MEEKKGFFRRLVSGLAKTRDNIVSGMDSIFHGFSKIDEEFYEELEETLIMGDLGVKATYAILDDLRKKVKEQHIKEPLECRQLLIDSTAKYAILNTYRWKCFLRPKDDARKGVRRHGKKQEKARQPQPRGGSAGDRGAGGRRRGRHCPDIRQPSAGASQQEPGAGGPDPADRKAE